MPKKIGVTGGIGSGKSLICEIFIRLGVEVYNADNRAKRLMTTDHELVSQIKKEFGELSYSTSGELNRTYLSGLVFNDSDRLKKLNSLVHPRVALDFNEWVRLHSDDVYVLKEAALMFDSGAYRELDGVIVVTASKQIRVKRVLERDRGRSEAQVLKIMENQMDEGEMIEKAQYVIKNDETEMIIPQVLKLHKEFSDG